MVQDVRLDDAVEEVAADEAELAVDGGGGAAGEGPGVGVVVGKGRVGVLEVRYGNCERLTTVCSTPEVSGNHTKPVVDPEIG